MRRENINNDFGNWSIDEICFEKIIELLPSGKTILEFGSGFGSGELSKYYNVYSIEHDMKWINKYNTNYIYAPLKSIKEDNSINWYDVDIIKNKIPKNYDLILVDGPPKNSSKNGNGRMGFYYNLHLFSLNNKIIIFDDVERKNDFFNMEQISKKINKPYKIFNGYNPRKKKKFGIML